MATANNIRKLCPNVVSTRAIYRAGSEKRFSKTCPPAKSLRRGGHSVALSSPWLSRHVLLSTLLECSLRRQFPGYQLPRGWGHHGSCLWHFTSAPSQSQMLNVLDGASFAKTARKKPVTNWCSRSNSQKQHSRAFRRPISPAPQSTVVEFNPHSRSEEAADPGRPLPQSYTVNQATSRISVILVAVQLVEVGRRVRLALEGLEDRRGVRCLAAWRYQPWLL